MPSEIFQNGLGLTSGGDLGTQKPLYVSDRTRWVDSQTGDASYTGKDRKFPLPTIADAVTAIGASDHGFIVCLSGHKEEISTQITFSQITYLIGEGTSAGKPAVELTMATTTTHTIELAAGSKNSIIENIYFRPPGNAASPAASTGNFILASSAADGAHVISDCFFDLDKNNDANGLSIATGVNNITIENCVFTSVETSTVATDKPFPAVKLATGIDGFRFIRCTLDDGAEGFFGGGLLVAAFDGTAGAVDQMDIRSLTLKNGSNISVQADSTGFIGIGAAGGAAKVTW